MRVTETGKLDATKLSHHELFWFTGSVVSKMPLTVAAGTITNV